MILDGKQLSNKLLLELKEKTNSFGQKPTLCVILIDGNPASDIYVTQKEKRCLELGFNFILKKYPKEVTETTLINYINIANKDNNINGIILQLPIPKHLNTYKIINSIDYKKDVDGLTDINIANLINNKPSLYPCTPSGIIDIFNNYNINVESKTVCIVGRSNLVGRPLSNILLNKNATIICCHSKTTNLKELTSLADILIVCCGKPNLITKDMVKKDSIVIDVGINKVNNKLCGDVDFNNVKDIVKYITPVPHGVGPMTVYELLNNTYKAYLLQKK